MADNSTFYAINIPIVISPIKSVSFCFLRIFNVFIKSRLYFWCKIVEIIKGYCLFFSFPLYQCTGGHRVSRKLMRPAGDWKLMWCYAPNILFLIMYLGKWVQCWKIFTQRCICFTYISCRPVSLYIYTVLKGTLSNKKNWFVYHFRWTNSRTLIHNQITD